MKIFALLALTPVGLVCIFASSNLPAFANADDAARVQKLHEASSKHMTQVSTRLQALDEINLALKIDPNNAGGYLQKAYVLSALEEDDEAALVCVERALKIKPDYAAAFAHRASIKMRSKDRLGALKDIDHAIKLDPNQATFYVQKSTLLHLLDRIPEAMKTLEPALKLEPNNMKVVQARCALAAERKDWKLVIADGTLLIKNSPANMPSRGHNLLYRAIAYQNLGDIDHAIADLEACVKFMAMDHRPHQRLLQLYKLKGNRAGVARETYQLKQLEADMSPF